MNSFEYLYGKKQGCFWDLQPVSSTQGICLNENTFINASV